MNRRARVAFWIGFLGCAIAGSPRIHASDQSTLKRIFSRWYVEQAGLGPFSATADYEIRETVEIIGADQPKKDVHLVWTRHDHFRFETALPGGTAVLACDGRVAWQAHPAWGVGLVANPYADPWVWQSDLRVAAKAFRAPITFRAVGRPDPLVNGRPCLVAAVRDAGKLEGKCFFDRKTHRLLRLERQAAPGSSVILAIEFDDFRETGGLTIPFVTRASIGSTVTVHRRSKVTLNPRVDEASFVLSTAELQQALAVDAVLKKHEATTGEAGALARIRSRVSRVVLEIPTTGTRSLATISQKSPNLIVIEIETAGMGREARGFDGTTGWVASELQGYRPLRPLELQQLMYEGSIHLVARLSETYPYRRWLGERVVNGRPVVAIALATQQGPAGVFQFDKENGRLLRITQPASAGHKDGAETTIDFSDFRTIDGLELPFQLIQTNALLRAVSTVQSVQNNVPLDDAIFRPRRDE